MVAHHCHSKIKNLTAKPKTSRQKQNTTRQNQKPHGKNNLTEKPNTSQQKQNSFGFAVRSLVLPWGFWFCREVFCFCRKVFGFAVRFLFSPRSFRFCCEVFCFCRAVFGFAVTIVGHSRRSILTRCPREVLESSFSASLSRCRHSSRYGVDSRFQS